MPDEYLSKLRISFAHSLHNGNSAEPEPDREPEPPPRSETEGQANRREHGYQDQLAVGTENLIRTVCRLVDDHLPWSVCWHG